jgi:hypothetical protein
LGVIRRFIRGDFTAGFCACVDEKDFISSGVLGCCFFLCCDDVRSGVLLGSVPVTVVSFFSPDHGLVNGKKGVVVFDAKCFPSLPPLFLLNEDPLVSANGPDSNVTNSSSLSMVVSSKFMILMQFLMPHCLASRSKFNEEARQQRYVFPPKGP